MNSELRDLRQQLQQTRQGQSSSLSIEYFSFLETISTSLWASLHHHFPILSVFSHVRCHFRFFHIFLGVVDSSPSRPPPSFHPRYDHVHHFSSEVVFFSSADVSIPIFLFCLRNVDIWHTLASSCMTWFLTWSMAPNRIFRASDFPFQKKQCSVSKKVKFRFDSVSLLATLNSMKSQYIERK